MVRCSLMRRERSTAKADSARISSTMPNAEDWKLKPGSGMRRCEPPAPPPGAANANTARFSDDHQSVDDVAELTQSRVVEAADHERRARTPSAGVDRLALVLPDVRVDVQRVQHHERAERETDRGEQQQRIDPQQVPAPPPRDGCSAIWIGVVVLIGRSRFRSVNGPGLPRNHCDEDLPRDRRGGDVAEAALLDVDDDDDRLAGRARRHVAGVPGVLGA